MSVSEDLETRLRSLSIDRGSDKAHAHGQPALSTVPTQPKATPPRRIWRRVGGLLLLGVAGVVGHGIPHTVCCAPTLEAHIELKSLAAPFM